MGEGEVVGEAGFDTAGQRPVFLAEFPGGVVGEGDGVTDPQAVQFDDVGVDGSAGGSGAVEIQQCVGDLVGPAPPSASGPVDGAGLVVVVVGDGLQFAELIS